MTKKTLAELVSDLSPDELRVFDMMLREAANEIHDYLIKNRERIAEVEAEERKKRQKESQRRYYYRNREKLSAQSLEYYYQQKEQQAAAT